MQSRKHLTSLTLLTVCGTAAVCLAYYLSPLMQRRDLSTRDLLVVSGKEAPRDPRLVYLAIDQESMLLDLNPELIASSPGLQLMKSEWPWSRSIYPLIIEQLFAEGAEVVALDILFLTPKPEDSEFKSVLDKYADRLVIGANVSESTREQFGTATLAIPSESLIAPSSATDSRVGFVNFWPDADGVVRSAQYRLTREQLAGVPADESSPTIFSLSARLLQKMGEGEKVPVTFGLLPLRFAGPPQIAFPKRPIYELFLPQNQRGPDFPPGFFKGKTVLVAPEGNFFHDEHLVPYGAFRMNKGRSLMPGPELHLNALNAALHGAFLNETTLPQNLLHIGGAGLLAWLLGFFVRRPVLRFFLILTAAAGLVGLSILLYSQFALYTLILSPILALLFCAVTFLVWEQVLERVERTRTRRTLERYVSRDVVAELLDNPATYFNALGGVRRDVTVLFTDLRGFTALTETADSEQLVTQLNEYFSEMVKHIFEQDGTLDKFMGDAIMATWGGLVTGHQAEQVAAAIEAGLQMKASLRKLNKRWHAQGRPELGMGVGINHGEAIVGNLGSDQKRDFTVIGDTVNLGSRLEGLTKEYGLDFIIGEQAAELVRDRFTLQLVDSVRVKGKSRPVRVYTVLGRSGEELPNGTAAYLAEYEIAMVEYRAAQFKTAALGFQRCMKLREGDPLSAVYVQRCQDLLENPVAEDWDGVFTMTSK